MVEFDDGYDGYYAERLWQLLPGVHRARDGITAGAAGPLHELVWRIGAQVAVVRRSIDRLWLDQSIETCDDWVIPYIGDLLDVNLVDGLDARGRRLDVAKTIHYRRRKGTLAILEEIARDVTGWQAHVVEAFRGLARARHTLDPPGAAIASALTATPRGGLADLRCVHGAALAGSPFDELAHTADLRAGRGAVGHHGIGKLLVFLWRLQAFPVEGANPVAVATGHNTFVFDPTGRRVPLFMSPLAPESDDFADRWTSALEWQVPGPLTDSLQRAIAAARYPDLAAIPPFATAAAGSPLEPLSGLTVAPEVGEFSTALTPPADMVVSYQYGLAAAIGAGPYDRLQLGDPPAVIGTPVTVSAGASPPLAAHTFLGLDAALTAVGASGTVQIADSRTYTAKADAGSTGAPIHSLLIQAGPQQRPVIRLLTQAASPGPVPLIALATTGSLPTGPAIPSSPTDQPHWPTPVIPPDPIRPPGPIGPIHPPAATSPPPAWTFTGGGDQALADAGLPSLTLDGLFFSGGDIVLRGAFATVRLTGLTADPGTVMPGAEAGYDTAVDGQILSPTRIWIEADPGAPTGAPGAIGQLLIDHCILGPVRTRNGGAATSVSITDSIVQGLAPWVPATHALSESDIHDPSLLAASLASPMPLAQHLVAAMPADARDAIAAYTGGAPGSDALQAILAGLNAQIGGGTGLDSVAPFEGVPIDPDLQAALGSRPAADIAATDRALLAAAFPGALATAALAIAAGSVSLERVTLLGSAYVHRLQASDSLLTAFSVAENAQDGCVRYSAVSAGSYTPRQYNCAQIDPHVSLFTSTSFGHPGYAQLLETADNAIVEAAAGVTVTAGAANGSEMGAFSCVLAPIKERGLLIKYGEYMPLGLTPVIVHVT